MGISTKHPRQKGRIILTNIQDMTVAFPLIPVVLAIAHTAHAKTLMQIYNDCYENAKEMTVLDNKATPKAEQLPEWCLAMRHDVAPCITEKVKYCAFIVLK
ncbi:unnamed protein product [Strongylus vulgaris]|uniref:Uncharacterized protein n=1 Tax=Strongylus vulgaris TaxID=40348 RepID=A0A3P7KD01_STRVU|nr:unnamed protein product [Strongylus vulgaris]